MPVPFALPVATSFLKGSMIAPAQPLPYAAVPGYSQRENMISAGLPDPWLSLSPDVLAAKQREAAVNGFTPTPIGGTQAQPGGAQGTPAQLGLPSVGQGITDAARAEFNAVKGAVGASLSSALERSNIEAAQRGGLRTGTQQVVRDDLRLRAAGIIAREAGATSLESQRLQANIFNAQRQFDLQVAQLEANKSQATNQLIMEGSKLFVNLLPDLMKSAGMFNSDPGLDFSTVNDLDFSGDMFGRQEFLPPTTDDFIG